MKRRPLNRAILAKLSGWCGLWLCLLAGAVTAGEVQVAVASNFARPMQVLAELFTEQTGHELKLAFASSGKFVAQITHGAPFEVLLSADADKPEQLIATGLALPDSRFTYALGTLVLWSAQTDLVDEAGKVLTRTDIKHLAMANPKLAPYGLAASEVLEKLGLSAAWQERLVQGDNIAQTQQFVASGNAELGFIALAQVIEQGKMGSGSGWIVPAEYHAPIQQDAVLLVKGEHNPAAHALLEFLQGAAAQAIIRDYGYQIPIPKIPTP